jgi:hypothetical protein
MKIKDLEENYYSKNDNDRTGFGRPPREMDEANLMYRYDTGDGKVKQRMIDNHDEKSAHQEGFRESI